jgi:hypothetical protein
MKTPPESEKSPLEVEIDELKDKIKTREASIADFKASIKKWELEITFDVQVLKIRNEQLTKQNKS